MAAASKHALIRIEVLGPLAIWHGDRPIKVGGGRQRRAIVSLVGAGPDGGSIEQLAEQIWDDADRPDPPDAPLRTLISRLRARVGDDRDWIVNRSGGGYRLDPERVDVDLWRFDRLIGTSLIGSETTLGVTKVDRMREAALEEAVELAKGGVFADVNDVESVASARSRVEVLLVDAQEQLLELWLASGRTERVVDRAMRLVDQHPYRERLRLAQAIGLYRSGRQAEALRALQDHRTIMAEEFGLDPATAVTELERKILDQDPGLLLDAAEVDRSLHGYHLGEEIGRGAFAVVHQANQATLDREVAVKIVRAEYADRPDFIRRFEAEAQLVARLEHPHIVPLYDYWREPGRACLVFRYLRGGNLERRLLSDGGIELERCWRVVSQVGGALAAAHNAGVVHRDVKPANVLLDEEGNFYLGDFGIAVEAYGVRAITDDVTVGSPAYASPEQLRREEVGFTADIYGMGITLFEALTGRLPFPGVRSAAELLDRQLNEPLPPVRSLRPELPADVDGVLAMATAKDPADRYETVDGFVAAFGDAIGDASTDGVGAGLTQRSTTRRGVTTAVNRPAVNPFKGLAAFGEPDADDFFGREEPVARLLASLARPGLPGKLVALVGPSGIGKSSTVRAGLVPRLRRGAIEGSERWFIATMVPGVDPFGELATALRSVAPRQLENAEARLGEDHRGFAAIVAELLIGVDAELLLVVDQFEELFTQSPTHVARCFIDALVFAIEDPACPVHAVLTLRADFWDEPLRHAAFARLLDDATLHLASLGPDELERAIVEPVHRAGADFETGLISRIVADVLDQPMALPMLQFTLTELWERCSGATMAAEAYEALGGVAGAIGSHAETVFDTLDRAEQERARSLLCALVSPGDDGPDTRRRVQRRELANDGAGSELIDRFGAARLLAFDRDPRSREQTVELAHEALLASWPRLGEWIDEDRDRLRLERHLAMAARSWDEGGRDPADLYGGARLVAIEGLAPSPVLGELEHDFVERSVETRKAVERGRRRQVRRLRLGLVGVAIVAVVAVIAGVVALVEQRRADVAAGDARTAAVEAETARNAAEQAAYGSDTLVLASASERLAAERPELALLLAVEAVSREENAKTREALAVALTAEPRFDGIVDVLGPGCVSLVADEVLRSAAVSGPAVGGAQTVSVTSFADDHPPVVHELQQLLACAQPSPDGDRILAQPVDGLVIIGADGSEIARSSFEVAVASWSTAGQGVVSVGRTDGRWEARLHDPVDLAVTTSVDVRVRDLRAVELVGDLALVHDQPPYLVDFAAGEVRSFGDVVSGSKVTLSSDGRYAAVVGHTDVYLFDTATGERLWRAELEGNGGSSLGLSIDPGSSAIAVPSSIGIELFDLEDGRRNGRTVAFDGQPFLTNESELFVVDADHRVIRLDLGRDARRTMVATWPGGGRGGIVAPDRSTGFTIDDDGRSIGVDLTTGEERELPAHMRPVNGGVYVGLDMEDGTYVIDDGDQVTSFDVSDRVPEGLASLRVPRVEFGQAVFVLHDPSLPSLSRNHVLVVDLDDGSVIGSFRAPGAFLADQLGPDRILLGRRNESSVIVDLTGEVIEELDALDDDVSAAIAGPSGEVVVGLAHGDTVRWSAEAGIIDVLTGEHAPVIKLVPVADGVIAQHMSGEITQWRWGDPEPVAQLAPAGEFAGLAVLAADGSELLVPVPGGAYSIPLSTERWVDEACGLVGDDLDADAWTAATGLPAPERSPCAHS